MDFAYERAGTNGAEKDKTTIILRKHDPFDDNKRKQLAEVLPQSGIPYVPELVPDEFVLLGIFHRRIIHRAMRGEDVAEEVRAVLEPPVPVMTEPVTPEPEWKPSPEYL